jgi:MscS family membrane protein
MSHAIQGVVKEITLRTTIIETADKSLFIIPNGRLLELPVSNLSNREKNILVIRVSLDNTVKVDHVRTLLSEIKSGLSILHPDIIKSQLSIQQGYQLVIKVFSKKTGSTMADKLVAQEVVLFLAEVMNKLGIKRKEVIGTHAATGLVEKDDLSNDFDSDMTSSLFAFYLM